MLLQYSTCYFGIVHVTSV